MAYQSLNPQELAEILHQENIAIIDVRDDDFDEDGYIPSAINVPSKKWDDNDLIDNLIASHSGKEKIIFHCRMSQTRGPSCATRYLERRNEIVNSNETDASATDASPSEEKKPEVLVLTGGYRGWQELYSNTPGMIATNKG